MSDTPLDGATETVAPSNPAAPPPNGSAGGPQDAAPASEVTSAPDPAKPDGDKPEQSRREARAYATLRRENRELHRQFGYMQAQIESLRAPAPQATEGEPAPAQRQTRAPSPVDQAQAELNRSILGTIEDAGEEYEAVVEKITADGFPMTVPMRDFLATSEKPAETAKYLADNPKEAARISLLSDRAADRALEKIEAGLKSAPKSAPKNSTAPPPVPTVGGRSTPNFDPQKADMNEYGADWKAKRGIKT